MRRRRVLLTVLLAPYYAPLLPVASSFSADQPSNSSSGGGIRLNKVFKRTHSRREADALFESGRVAVNGKTVEQKGGFFVIPYVDEVSLDGKIIEGWEEYNGILPPDKGSSSSGSTSRVQSNKSKPRQSKGRQDTKQGKANSIQTKQFQYIKYWKPRGVTCTMDRNDRSNIIDAIRQDGYQPNNRIYPVGRLDKDTSGLILLTSDGRLPNSALRMKNKQPKVYEVVVDRKLRDADLRRLRDGVVITTDVARNGKHRALTQKTLPCEVEKVDDYCLRMTLVEGRNRQVRKMTAALDYFTVELMRIEFMGIPLEPLRGPGDWALLDEEEMDVVRAVLANAASERDVQ